MILDVLKVFGLGDPVPSFGVFQGPIFFCLKWLLNVIE